MKLLVAHVVELERYVSREWWMTFLLLAEAYGWKVLDSDSLPCRAGSFPDFAKSTMGRMPDAILFREAYSDIVMHMPSLRAAGTRVFVMTEDLHEPFDGMGEALRAADGVLTPYAPRLASFFPEVDPARVTWIPHSAGPDFLLPLSESPEPRVFVSGNMNRANYPFRLAMRELALRRPELARLHAHPGYARRFELDRDPRVGQGFATAMQGCLAAFTDASRYGYLVAKHFEIPAMGALLIAERAVAPQLAMLGFLDGRHYVSASPDDLERVVAWVVDPSNRGAVDAIRRRGHALVHERHTVAERAAAIDAACI